MATLTGKKIKDTYDGLLKLINSALGLPTNGKVLVQDGLGNDSALQLGRANNGATITGQLVLSKNTDKGAHISLLRTGQSDAYIISRNGNIAIGGTSGYSVKNLNVKKDNGYVGIQQKVPLAPLHIKRNGEAIRLECFGDNQSSIDFWQETTRDGLLKKGHIEFDNFSDTLEIKTTNPSGPRSKIKFSVALENQEATEAMRIQNSVNGNKQVLIGGANESVPDNKEGLWVFGDIETSGRGTFNRDLRVSGTLSVFDSDLSVDGRVDADSFKVKGLNSAPASSTSSGKLGEIRFTASHIYLYVGSNKWRRVALQDF